MTDKLDVEAKELEAAKEWASHSEILCYCGCGSATRVPAHARVLLVALAAKDEESAEKEKRIAALQAQLATAKAEAIEEAAKLRCIDCREGFPTVRGKDDRLIHVHDAKTGDSWGCTAQDIMDQARALRQSVPASPRKGETVNTNELCYLAELARKDTDRRRQAFHGIFDPVRLANDLLALAKEAESQEMGTLTVAIFNSRITPHDWTSPVPASHEAEAGEGPCQHLQTERIEGFEPEWEKCLTCGVCREKK